eukprot:scaffold59035_cov63-Phaeocystis_antarctica.AAC.9
MPLAAHQWAARGYPDARPPESRSRPPRPVRAHPGPAHTAAVPPARLFGSCASLIDAASPATDHLGLCSQRWHHPSPRDNCARSRSW